MQSLSISLVNVMNEVFDKLIWEYFWEKHNINLYKQPLPDTELFTNYEILEFTYIRKQFVCKKTRGVLFEVYMSADPNSYNPVYFGELNISKLVTKRYWEK